MIKVETKSGFKCKIDETIINRYSFVKLMAKVDKNPSLIPDMIGMILGEDEERLIDHLGGNPSIEEMAQEIADVFDAIRENAEAKKS